MALGFNTPYNLVQIPETHSQQIFPPSQLPTPTKGALSKNKIFKIIDFPQNTVHNNVIRKYFNFKENLDDIDGPERWRCAGKDYQR